MKNLVPRLRKAKRLYVCTVLLLLFLAPQIYARAKNSPDNSSAILSDRYSQISQEAEESQKKGKFEKAIEEFNKSRKIAIKISDKEKECDTLIKLGLLYWNTGNLNISSQFYSDAQSIAQENGLKTLEENCQNALKIRSLYNQGKKYRY